MILRVPLRLTGLVAVTVPLFAGWLLTRPVAWLAPRTAPALQRLWVGTWSKASLWLMGVRVRFEGEIPTGPPLATRMLYTSNLTPNLNFFFNENH